MKPFKTVLVGCGGISDNWLSVVCKHPAIEMVGLVDLNRDTALNQAGKYDLEPGLVNTNLASCLDQTGAQLVFDCTVPPAHCEVVLTALEAGCHVFGEKPLAETMDQAERMVASAYKKGLTYGVMQNRRWQPAGINRVKAVLDRGAIGKPHTLHSDFFIGAHFGGFREEMKHVLLLDMAIHSFDQARYLTPALPQSVWASDWNPPGSWYGDGASAVAFFEHADQVRTTYRGSWCSEGFPGSWQCTWRIIGDKGTLLWDGEEGITAERVVGRDGFIRESESVEIPPVPEGAKAGHDAAIHDFLESLQSGKPPATPASDNIHSLAMVLGAVASAESGEKVRL